MFNQFIFLNAGLVESNEDYLKSLLPINIGSFIATVFLCYYAFKKIDSSPVTGFRTRLLLILLLLKLQPFLLLDPLVYQEFFFYHQLTYSLYYSYLAYFWMAEFHALVFHVMSSPKSQKEQEEVQVPAFFPKILAIVSKFPNSG